MSPNNPTSGEIKQEVPKVGEVTSEMRRPNYKLPTVIESRFDDEFHKRGGWFEQSYPFDCWDAFDTLRGFIKNFFATEQVTLLESIVSDIENMKKTGHEDLSVFERQHLGLSPDKANKLYGHNKALDAVIAKVEAKIKEYKV